METLLVYPQNKEQLLALKACCKALKIDFAVQKSPYSYKFVAKIRRAEREIKEGKYMVHDPNKSLWENLRSERLSDNRKSRLARPSPSHHTSVEIDVR